MKKHELVLLRHGESEWNRRNLFTGWVDVDLSPQGVAEAQAAGQLLKVKGYQFDIAFTSVLKRAIRTLWITLDELDQMWLPVEKSWRLNERHYGALQGLNKKETSEKYGDDQVFTWRRSYDIPPPEIDWNDQGHPRFDRRYKAIHAKHLPAAEALKQCQARVLPFWQNTITAALQAEQQVLICAHGNSLRSLIKHLDQIPDDQISELNIPTGIPLVYELDKQFKPLRHYYLGDAEEAKKRIEAVSSQAKK